MDARPGRMDQVVLAALTALRERGQVDAKTCAEAIARYGPAPDVLAPWLA